MTSPDPHVVPLTPPTPRVPPDIHNSGHATHGSDVLAQPVALLTSPSGCTGATGTASTSVVANGEDRSGGSSGQLSSDDHVDWHGGLHDGFDADGYTGQGLH
jgi:hypothetical protein